ncbi:UNVERIFIED_CONTAM: hypothetical protein RMT77_007078 [Armadillidium vulgare]
METNCVICLFIGLPGSGKTTLCNKLTTYLNNCDVNSKVINFEFDSFINLEEQSKLVTVTKNDREEKIFKTLRNEFAREIENTIENIKNNLIKYVILVDDNFYYKSMRYKFYQMAAKFNCGYCQVYLDCCLDLALERNNDRSSKVNEEAIKTMAKRMEVPNKSCQWEAESFISSANAEINIEDVSSFVNSNFLNARSLVDINALDKTVAQNLNLKSLLHRSDLILRTLVGEIIKHKSAEGFNKKEVANLANNYRQEILSNFRNQTLKMPCTVIGADEINALELEMFLRLVFSEHFSSVMNS